MKATGIIRRIDDLGRIVIPREIRRTMHIREGDPLEIFIDSCEGTVCFKKYSPLGNMKEVVHTAEKLLKKYNAIAAIYDRDSRLTDGINFPNEPFPSWECAPDDWEFNQNGIAYKVHNIYVNGEIYGFIVYIDAGNMDRDGVIAVKQFIAAALED